MNKLFYLIFLVCISGYGQSKCYLDYHMKYGFKTNVFCWGSNSEKFLDTLSIEARNHLDSIFNRFGVDPKNVICQKIKLNETGDLLKENKLKNVNYYFSAFERTFDCYDRWTFKNFGGNVEIKSNSKVILEYALGVKKDYEMLMIYIINDRVKFNVVQKR